MFCDGDALTAQDFPHYRNSGRCTWAAVRRCRTVGGVQLYTEDGTLRPLEDIEADVIRLAIATIAAG